MIDDKQLHSVPGMEGYYYDDNMQLYTVCQLKKQRETQCVYRIRIHGVPTNFNLEEYLTQRVNHTVPRPEHSVSESDHTVPEGRHSVPDSSSMTQRVEHSVSDRDRITEQGPYEGHKDVEHSVSNEGNKHSVSEEHSVSVDEGPTYDEVLRQIPTFDEILRQF